MRNLRLSTVALTILTIFGNGATLAATRKHRQTVSGGWQPLKTKAAAKGGKHHHHHKHHHYKKQAAQ